jgi:ribosomal protein S18 acetylase RimI-like enzyme
MLSVDAATEVTDELVEAFARLVPQLSGSSPPPTRLHLAQIIDSPATTLFLARASTEEVVGTLTLVTFRTPTGVRAWIEDVVVDEAVRGQGVGEALTNAALTAAQNAGARTVDLTSRPSREAANRLYQRLGFTQRQTNVYRCDLSGSSGQAPEDGGPSQE